MEDPEQKPSKKETSPWQFAGVGTEFGIIIIASVFLGKYLDSRFGWSPFGILGGVTFGFTYGIYYILYRLAQFEKKE